MQFPLICVRLSFNPNPGKVLEAHVAIKLEDTGLPKQSMLVDGLETSDLQRKHVVVLTIGPNNQHTHPYVRDRFNGERKEASGSSRLTNWD